MRTIAIVNQKGGSGKTTTAINLAALYAQRGFRTLLIDMDPQAHCAAGLGVPEQRIERGVADGLLADHRNPSFDPSDLLWEVSRNLMLMPSTVRLAGLEAPGGGLHERPDRDRRLLSLLERFQGMFDRCLIDCPPTIGLLTFNAMRAARETLIPVETGFFAMKGAERQWQTIRSLVERIDRAIAVHLLPTIHDDDSRIARDVLSALRRKFAGQIVPVVIHDHQVLREAVSFGQPITEYDPHSKARQDFEKLVEWLECHQPAEPGQLADPLQDQPARQIAINLHHRPGESRSSTPSISASTSLAPSSRVAELVRRVQSIANENAQRDSQLQQSVAAAVPNDPPQIETIPASTCPANLTTPTLNRQPPQVQADTSPVSSAPTDAADDMPESLDTPSVRPDGMAPPCARDADSDSTIDASPPLVVATDAASGTTPAEPSPSAAHLFGVRPTSAGVLFVQPAGDVRTMCVAGDFNHWSPTANPLRRNSQLGIFEAVIPMIPGRHQYRLVVDGVWRSDSYNPHQQRNDYGEPNSVVVVDHVPKEPSAAPAIVTTPMSAAVVSPAR